MRQARRFADITQQQMAIKLGISQSRICKLERGLVEWPETTKRDYEKALQRKPATRRKS